MDWESFVLSLADILVWPLVVAVIVWVLRAPITELLNTIRRFRASGFGSNVDMEFSQGVREIATVAATLDPTPPDPAAPISPPADENLSDRTFGRHTGEFNALRIIADREPRMAITEAWELVEKELDRLELLLGGTTSRDTMIRVTRLAKTFPFSPGIAVLITGLRNLRNSAAHKIEPIEISTDQAYEYISVVLRIVQELQRFQRG